MKFPSMRTAPAASLGQPRTTHRACRSGPFCRFGAYGKKRAKLLLRVHNLIHLTQGRCMAEKQLAWAGSSYKDLTDDDTFPMEARKVAGQQLRKIQRGDEPDDWKPFEEIGAGTKEIRIKLPDGAFRVMYVANFLKQFMSYIVSRRKPKEPVSRTRIWPSSVTSWSFKKGVNREF